MKTDIFTIAHEMKNPLCVAKGYLEMMNKENFERYKEIINNEINNSIEILDNYLSFNKINIEKEELDLNVLLSDIKKSMKDYLKKLNVNLNIQMVNDDIYLNGDYNKLKQVFYNIIKNSVEAHAKNIYIYYKILYHKLNIYIENDGDQIENNIINQIGNNYSAKILGHGIGLTLSKKIITLHQGKISYKNNEEKGITTIITLNLN